MLPHNLESMLIWGAVILISILFTGGYFVMVRNRRNRDMARKTDAEALGMDKAPALFPMIDESKCIGCGLCTRSCPMGDVLGVVDGVSTVIEGVKCIGIAKCALNCPVGAIRIGLGNLEKRGDIPKLDENYESNLSRIFIPGELNGQSLIKNAIRHGKQVVDVIAERVAEEDAEAPKNGTDIVIVGAGPAGLTAALAAKQKGLSSVIIDTNALGGTIAQYPKGKPTLIDPVVLPYYGKLDEYEYPKEKILAIFQSLAKEQALDVRIGPKMVGVTCGNSFHTVQTAKHGDFKGTYVLLALGRAGMPRKLNVPGETLPHVEYKLVDPADYQFKKILVVGGGDSAVEAAMALARQPGNQVALSYRRHKFFRIKALNEKRIGQMAQKGKVALMFNSDVIQISEQHAILEVENGKLEMAADSVFIFAGGLPPFQLLKSAGIQFWGEKSAAQEVV